MSNAGRRRSSLSPTKKAEKKKKPKKTHACMHQGKCTGVTLRHGAIGKEEEKKEKKEKKKVLEGITPCFFNLSAAGHTKK